MFDMYIGDAEYKKKIDKLVSESNNFDTLVRSIKEDLSVVLQKE